MLTLEIKNDTLQSYTNEFAETQIVKNESSSEPATKTIGEFTLVRSKDFPANCLETLVIENHVDVTALDIDFNHYQAIILMFPAFNDGRAYSQARNLRERLGFKGDIVARGDVLIDQALFMKRCGFNVLEIVGENKQGFENALNEYRHFYQPSADDKDPVWALRQKSESVAA